MAVSEKRSRKRSMCTALIASVHEYSHPIAHAGVNEDVDAQKALVRAHLLAHVDPCMSARLSTASLRNPGSSELQCLRCDCNKRLCFVSMMQKSIQKSISALNSSVVCPAHQGRSSSKWVINFYNTLETLAADMHIHGVVWDWHDVPGAGNHRMHVDACVFVGTACVRFEIDGEVHFSSQGTARDWRDVAKDSIFRALAVGLVHLHWRDASIWESFIRTALQSESAAVEYTPSYHECLEADENARIN